MAAESKGVGRQRLGKRHLPAVREGKESFDGNVALQMNQSLRLYAGSYAHADTAAGIVGAAPAFEDVVADAAEEAVRVGLAVQLVVAVVAFDDVQPGAAEQAVVVGVAVQLVVAAVAVDFVVAGVAVDGVVLCGL